jgi:two-component system, NtrC family, response regulator AtoC
MKKILIIDDDQAVTSLLKVLLTRSGYKVIVSNSGKEGMEKAIHNSPDLVITDYEMPDATGMDVIRHLEEHLPGTSVVVLTCHSDVSLTIKMIQAGAFDYIEKPIQPQRLLETIKNGITVSVKNRHFKSEVPEEAKRLISENFLIGLSSEIRDLVKQIGRISMTRMHVMVTGEPGTGKIQVANLIHYSGVTRENPFVVVNCEALNEQTASLELIGHTDDHYGRMDGGRKGKLIQAGEGTLVLNSFEALPMVVQQNLSRIIADKMVYMPGMEDVIPFEGRVIAISEKPIEELVSKGLLHNDLYYQLKVFQLQLPALRHRLNDLIDLVDYFIDKHSQLQSKKITGLEDGTLDLMRKYPWPGNLRELENAIAQAITLSKGNIIEKEQIRLFTQGMPHTGKHKKIQNVRLTLNDIEKEYIKEVLDDVKWVKSEAADILQITRPTLNAKIIKYGLKR